LIRLEITAEAVAWYAAIVATASALVSAYNVLRDRARLLIQVQANMRPLPGDVQHDTTKDHIMVRVVNAGRRPTIITHVWFEPKCKGAPNILLAHCLKMGPQELAEGKWAAYLLEQTAVDLKEFKYVCVSDSAGRTYRKKITRKLRKAAQSSDATQTHLQDGGVATSKG